MGFVSVFKIAKQCSLYIFISSMVFACGVKVEAMEDEKEQRIIEYYIQAKNNYDNGNYVAAREFINKALTITPENGDYPGIFVLSSMLYMQNGDCSSALKEIQITLEKLDRLALLIDHKKVDVDKDFGVDGASAFNENYYISTKVYAYCNYQLEKPEESKRGFLVIEKRWKDKFKLGEMVRLGHNHQLTGDNANAIKYYAMSLLEADSRMRDQSVSREGERKIVESTWYNIAIAYYEQNNMREALKNITLLLSKSADPYYWIGRMESDDDYKTLLRENNIRKTIDSYKKKQ